MSWNWITNRIAVGSAPSEQSIATMRAQGITDVLDLRGEPRAREHEESGMYAGSGIDYHYVPMLDRGIVASTNAEADQKYYQGIGVIRSALAKPNGKILVHCAAGISRSPSMVYAYLRSTGMSPEDAWNAVKSRRAVASTQYVRFADAAIAHGVPATIELPATGTGSLIPMAIIAVGALLVWQGSRGSKTSIARVKVY